MMIGSPEWFHEKAKNKSKLENQEFVEGMRESFLERFSPNKLSQMSGEELLRDVFGNNDNAMIHLLMYDGNYRWFGAPGKYKYLSIVYQKNDGEWIYNEANHAVPVSKNEAAKKAEYIRDILISCIKEIEDIGIFETIQDYYRLDERIAKHFIYKHAWVIKYYQMVYPQYFAAMYADLTIDRALSILGLQNHGKSKRLINVGEISLFIRKCDVNNIIFNVIYADEWGWEGNHGPCASASKNHGQSSQIIKTVNTSFYRLPDNSVSSKEIEDQLDDIAGYVDKHDLKGEERECIVKARVNQGVFRERLIKKYGKCCLCGVVKEEFLIAGHIKPWAVSSGEEKLDVNNGILLCPNHDKLFDRGYISFDEDGHLLISRELDKKTRVFMNVDEKMHFDEADQCAEYLRYHRETLFKK